MSVFTIPRSQFDWPSFARAIGEFSLLRGADEAFQLVQEGQVILDMEDLALDDGEGVADISDDPVERLEAGFDLLAQFALFQGFGELACADGSVIEVPDLNDDDLDNDDLDDDDEERPRLTAAQRRLIEKTECDECRSYGFQISLDGPKLVLQAVLVSESNGDCEVDAVVDAGLVERPMAKFINNFVKKRARRKS